ncbi:hypothetical protein ACFPN4_02960 [Ureibacillus thermophilus]|uniref:Swarming motility protein SwrB n=1 Tax=Ureibacillus thermophilus TaxID=367743 RepID=A0A4P6UQW1_9BACL|nr:hypothetical protein [Ureibacillus thermophilus]QBK25659.1 hypothetical protein DKZ56_07190 [Ureibacillus thermophilus]
MAAVFIILLIISQLICFFLIFILNSKISKYKDLELRQDKLMDEIENAISVYLLEFKEENDRFIKELSNIKPSQQTVQPSKESKPVLEVINKNSSEKNGMDIEKIPVVPKTVAKNAYIKQKKNATTEQEKMPETAGNENGQNPKGEMNQKEMSFKEKVIALHQEGKSIEEIAKITQKGKTEIELLLKFQA